MTAFFSGTPPTMSGLQLSPILNLLHARRVIGDAFISAEIGASQTDWEPTGLADAQVISVTQDGGPFEIRSMDGGDVKVAKVILNDDASENLTLKHEYTSGTTAAMRFSLPGASDVVISPGYGACLVYDTNSSRWNCVATAVPYPLANEPGVDGTGWYTGAGSPSASPDFGNDGDLYLDTGGVSPDTAGNVWQKISGSWGLIASIRGHQGDPGFNGSDGADPGILLVWDTGTSDANPGSGKIRANNASLASATVLYVSKTSKGGSDISDFLASLDDSTNTKKGDLLLTKPSNDTQSGFVVAGITDASGYVKVAVSAPFGATSFSTADAISLQFTRSGDKGADGLGTGDVVGPASSASHNLAGFSDTSGKAIEDTGVAISTDGSLSSDSDTKIPTEKAVKEYADALIGAVDAVVFKGAIDASTNPNFPAADAGHLYRISVAGKIGGASGINVEQGDEALCIEDGTASGDAATVGSKWVITQANIDGAVIGPASATSNHVAQFDGTTGKLIKGGKAAPSGDFVGTTDTQELTGKTIAYGNNTISGLPAAIEFVIDGGGAAITTGIKGDLEIPFGCTIQAVTLLGDQTGSIVVDIWKDTYANFPPTDADSITASAPPTISSAVKGQDSTLTGWTKTIGAGDILRFNVDSVTDIQRATLSLKVVKI
jgi:hypothetical protein